MDGARHEAHWKGPKAVDCAIAEKILSHSSPDVDTGAIRDWLTNGDHGPVFIKPLQSYLRGKTAAPDNINDTALRILLCLSRGL